jgi:hypothetical protein
MPIPSPSLVKRNPLGIQTAHRSTFDAGIEKKEPELP